MGDVRDPGRQEGGQGRGHDGEDERVDDRGAGRVVLEEDEAEVPERQVLPRPAETPRLRQRRAQEGEVREPDRARQDAPARAARDPTPAAQRDGSRHGAGAAPARDGREAAPADEPALHPEETRRQPEEGHRVGGRDLDLGRVVEEGPDLRGHHVEARRQGQHGRRAEEDERLQEREDEPPQDRRPGQGQRDVPHHGQAARPRDPGRVLQVRRRRGEGRPRQDEHGREGVEARHEDEPGHREDVDERGLGPGEGAVEDVQETSVRAGQDDPRRRAEEGGRDEGADGEGADEALAIPTLRTATALAYTSELTIGPR